MQAHVDDAATGLFRYLDDDGALIVPASSLPPAATQLAMWREMTRIRLLDERMLMRQRQGKVGFYGTITGQEATPIATAFSVGEQDWIFPALREAAIMLVRGFPLERWLAQVYGNQGDVLKGRQMPSHMSGRMVHQVSWSSCIGPQVPQAVGAAMAARARGDDTVTVGFLGDGATSQGDFHAAMTFASRFRPPCVIVCQNNHWSISVPTERQTASRTLAIKAQGYGLRGVRVDGNDALALHRVLSDAVARARRGEGPTFVESVTYRIGPHSSSDDPTRYRREEEVEAWRRKDPIMRLGRHLASHALLAEEAQRAERDAIERAILDAIRAVETLPMPERVSLFDDVFAQPTPELEAQRQELERGPHARAHG